MHHFIVLIGHTILAGDMELRRLAQGVCVCAPGLHAAGLSHQHFQGLPKSLALAWLSLDGAVYHAEGRQTPHRTACRVGRLALTWLL